MVPQPWQPGQPWPGDQSGMRASNADRERTVDVIKAAFAEGRLTQQEYEDRVGRALRAATYGELGMLVSDLPQGPLPTAPALPPPRPLMPSPYPPPFLPVPPPPPRRPTNPYAIGSLVCGLAAPFTGVLSVPAVVLGHTAKSKLRTTGEEGDGLANAGIVLGWLSVVLWMLILVAAIA